eukprot:TRINITY_DN32776_c0_g1_i1.p1 TRINITY_DN32776_c0_g1~~TRINITY_DN32776_c0_g1_i1.p1  ORF type:complete len:398 (+),score=64.49 TRINITY_DN32776_c0_g1_i1:117-1310(+)
MGELTMPASAMKPCAPRTSRPCSPPPAASTIVAACQAESPQSYGSRAYGSIGTGSPYGSHGGGTPGGGGASAVTWYRSAQNWQPVGPNRPIPCAPHGQAPSRPGSRPSSARSQRPGSAGRRLGLANHFVPPSALEDELRGPPLGPVPINLATPMERRVAEALGIAGHESVLRIPLEAESCTQGTRCCWRWLARAALEEVGGARLAASFNGRHASLAEFVSALREELASANEKSADIDTCKEQMARDAKEIDRLKERCRVKDAEVAELHSLRDECRRTRAECLELRTANARMIVNEARFDKELAALRLEHRALVEGDLVATKARARDAELDAAKVRMAAADWQKKCEDALENDASSKAELSKLRKELAMFSRSNKGKKLRKGGVARGLKARVPAAARG